MKSWRQDSPSQQSPLLGDAEQSAHQVAASNEPSSHGAIPCMRPGCAWNSPARKDIYATEKISQKQELVRDFQKALETTTAMKRHKILRNICSNCAVSNLSLRGRCISRSLHDAAKVVISRLLTRNCCGLAVVVSVIVCLSMMARWRSRRFTVVATLVVVSRSLPLWDLGGSNWDTRKS